MIRNRGLKFLDSVHDAGYASSVLMKCEIDHLHTTGYLVIRGLFRGEELKQLRAAADRIAAEGAAGGGRDHWSREVGGRMIYFRSERLWDRDDIFQAAAVNPNLLTCIGQVLGHPFLPMNDSMVCKLPGGNVPVEWHQDPPYQGAQGWAETFGVPNIDVDIYLDEATEENGCLYVVPGHHLVGKVDIERFGEEDLYREHGAVPMCMQPGDVGLHALSAPHGSRGNCSDRIRRVLFFHYVSREVYDACYSGWMTHHGGYTPDGVSFVYAMLEKRARLGFSGLAGHAVAQTSEGFVYTGDTRTPPYHWRDLIALMQPEEVERKRRLEWLRPPVRSRQRHQ